MKLEEIEIWGTYKILTNEALSDSDSVREGRKCHYLSFLLLLLFSFEVSLFIRRRQLIFSPQSSGIDILGLQTSAPACNLEQNLKLL